MLNRIPIVLFLVFISYSPGVVEGRDLRTSDNPHSQPDFQFGVSVSRAFGETGYTMDALTQDPRDPDVVVPIRSELEFPLDAVLVGLEGAWYPRYSRWSFAASLRINANDPASKMTDSDFFEDRQIFFGESDPELDLILATADTRVLLRDGTTGSLAALLRIEYQRIQQYIVGFDGWQGSLFSDIRIPVSESEPALAYEVNYLNAQLGGAVVLKPSEPITFEIDGAGGVLFAWDRDDHLLRGRVSEGRAIGLALYARGNVDWQPEVFGWSWLSFDLWGELRYFHAEGGVDQKWYAGGNVGNSYDDLPYKLESFQPQVGVSLTVSH